MYRSADEGIQLSGIILPDGPEWPRYEMAPDHFEVAAGETGLIVAPPVIRGLLADVLTGLTAPDAGEIYVRGKEMTGLSPGQREIALVPADGGLLPHLTVERNAGFALAGTGPRKQRRARVRHVLAQLELGSLARLRPHQLSAEQGLRVAVARARCLPPPGACAVVIEDCGTAACQAAVATAAGDDFAVVVIVGSEDRARELGACGGIGGASGARALARLRPVRPPVRPQGVLSDPG